MKKILLLADKYLKLAAQLDLFGPTENKDVVKPTISIPSLKELSPSTTPGRRVSGHEKKLNKLNQNSTVQTMSAYVFSFNSKKDIERFQSKIEDLVKLVHESCYILHLNSKIEKIKQNFNRMQVGDKETFVFPIKKLKNERYEECDTKFKLQITIAKKEEGGFSSEVLFLDYPLGEDIEF
jgi:hypothetical protein